MSPPRKLTCFQCWAGHRAEPRSRFNSTLRNPALTLPVSLLSLLENHFATLPNSRRYRKSSMKTSYIQSFLAKAVCAAVLASASLFAQPARIRGHIDGTQRIALKGHIHPKAQAEYDQGPVDASFTLPSMSLVLKPSAAQQADLDQLLQEQQDPASANYHRWLTPEEYAGRFGLSDSDLNQITAWLEQQSMTVLSVARGRNSISFTGPAARVQSAFGTEIHRYVEDGDTRFANASEPTLPVALAVVVKGIRGLNNFRIEPRRLIVKPLENGTLKPEYTNSRGTHYLAPDDVSTIYNIAPLYNAGINGTGQKIAIAGQTNIDVTDIQQFRSRFALPTNDPQILLVPNLQDPGTSKNDLDEADLDVEWAGAIARNASIIYVYSNDVMDAAQYVIDQNLAPVLSISYGLCEAETASSDALIMQGWARQANSQGITWLAASGDSGGSDCYTGKALSATALSVDLPAGIPEVTGVGGTAFVEQSGSYWNPSNGSSGASVLSYIPETSWNDGTLSSPGASGGGASVYFSKPSWQTGLGVPADGARDVPDVSLSASPAHDGFLYYSAGSLGVVGGTSIGAPTFGGLVALMNQSAGSSGGQGNINPSLYKLAQSNPAAFHDIATGDNIVAITCSARAGKCVSGSYGFSAGPGYDQVTGLGSVDASALISSWSNHQITTPLTAPSFTVTASSSSISATGSLTVTAKVTSSNSTTPTGTVAFFAGATSLGSALLSGSNGTATATLTITGGQLPVGSGTIRAQYSGDLVYGPATASFAVNVTGVASGPPVITAVLNGASFQKTFAPGMILSVFGSRLATATGSASAVPLPNQLAGASATINGIAAPLYYASPSQLNLQIPYEITANSPATLKITSNGQSGTTSFLVSAAAPGVFSDSNGAVVPNKTAARSQVISLYITGQGAVTPAVATGAASSSLSKPVQTPTVTIGGVQAPIQFIGIPSGLVGVTQINCQVPGTAALGTRPVVVTIGNFSSVAATLTITP